MLGWAMQNAQLLQLVFEALTVFVWFLYLHLILMNFMRQRQSVILVTRGTSRGPAARCFVTNMGSEPIYLVAAFAFLDSDQGSYMAPVTDRDELALEDVGRPSDATNQGPLVSGEFRDIGDFQTIETRARAKSREGSPPEAPDKLTVVIVAASGHAARLVGCYQSFSVTNTDNGAQYAPEFIVAKQIRNLRRSRWRHLLEEMD